MEAAILDKTVIVSELSNVRTRIHDELITQERFATEDEYKRRYDLVTEIRTGIISLLQKGDFLPHEIDEFVRLGDRMPEGDYSGIDGANKQIKDMAKVMSRSIQELRKKYENSRIFNYTLSEGLMPLQKIKVYETDELISFADARNILIRQNYNDVEIRHAIVTGNLCALNGNKRDEDGCIRQLKSSEVDWQDAYFIKSQVEDFIPERRLRSYESVLKHFAPYQDRESNINLLKVSLKKYFAISKDGLFDGVLGMESPIEELYFDVDNVNLIGNETFSNYKDLDVNLIASTKITKVVAKEDDCIPYLEMQRTLKEKCNANPQEIFIWISNQNLTAIEKRNGEFFHNTSFNRDLKYQGAWFLRSEVQQFTPPFRLIHIMDLVKRWSPQINEGDAINLLLSEYRQGSRKMTTSALCGSRIGIVSEDGKLGGSEELIPDKKVLLFSHEIEELEKIHGIKRQQKLYTFQEKIQQEGKAEQCKGELFNIAVGEYIRDCNKNGWKCDLSNLEFPYYMNFTQYEYDNIPQLIFDGCRFYAGADFSNLRFKNTASFKGVMFDGGLNYHSTQANFTCTTFYKHVDFHKSVFANGCYFVGADFRMGADFRFVKFGKKDGAACSCDFSTTYPKGHNLRTNDDGACDFVGNMEFKGAVFYASHVTFKNRIIEEELDFENVVFYWAPDFNNCELSQRTHFYNTEFKDVSSKGAASSYRILKMYMLNMFNGAQAQVFEGLEEKSRSGYLAQLNTNSNNKDVPNDSAEFTGDEEKGIRKHSLSRERLKKLKKLKLTIKEAAPEIKFLEMDGRPMQFVYFINSCDPTIFQNVDKKTKQKTSKANGKNYNSPPRSVSNYLRTAGIKFKKTGGMPIFNWDEVLERIKNNNN